MDGDVHVQAFPGLVAHNFRVWVMAIAIRERPRPLGTIFL